GIANDQVVFDLVAVTIAISIVLHSSTDVAVARTLRVNPPNNLPSGPLRRRAAGRSRSPTLGPHSLR
ncbi:MAG TPA: hypothetical protein VE197_11885, partial [Mycobacterium sp.]|nr:hypothetical protein [Mycobacterium sp.]